jgi:hypothetical protein
MREILLKKRKRGLQMIDVKVCEWLLENADAPIRYRVLREFMKDEQAAKKMENELFDYATVKQWLKKLKPESPPQQRSITEMTHHSHDYALENAMQKIVQLGLHAEMPPVIDAVQYFLSIIKNTPIHKPYRKDIHGHYRGLDLVSPVNMLVLGGFKDDNVLEIMLGSLDELYAFVSKGNCDIYLTPEERVKLKGVPKSWADIKHFTKPELFDEHGLCWPQVYDIFGLTGLYGVHSLETDRKIDAVIDYISNDNFHKTTRDGYGIVITTGKTKYKGCGWDPKYPGWFDVADYIKNATNSSAYDLKNPGFVPKLLFFAMYIVKYPAARKTKWFSDLLNCLKEYKTEKYRYEFPNEWLVEKQGCAVLGNHMSFGENRRKNWCEIESTFYMQLLTLNL